MSKKYMFSKATLSVLTAGLMGFAPVAGPIAQVLNAPSVALAATADYSDATTIDLSSLAEGKYDGYKVEAAEILLADGETAAEGYEGITVLIQEAGTYRLTGSATNVNVAVKKGVTGVTLVLDNVTLSCDYTAPITVRKGAEATIVLVGESTITDDESLSNDDVLDDYEGAAIKAKAGSTLTLTGDGTLNIVGNTKHGIRATCDPSTEGEEHVTLNVLSGTYNISVQNEAGDWATADGDGIHSDDVLNLGYEGMSDSELTVNVTKATEGLEGGVVNIYGGTIGVTSTDDGINAANSDYASAGVSYDFAINVYGGNLTVNAGGDGIDSNGNILTQDGTIYVYSSSGGNGAMDKGDGNYTWTNVNATVIALGQGSMEETPSSGTYVAFGNTGFGGGMGGFGGQGQGGRGMFTRSADEDASAEDADAVADDAEGTALEVARGGFGGGQMPSDMGGQGGFGGQDGMMQGGSAIVSAGQALTLSDGTTTIDLGTALGNAASVIVASPSLASGTTYTLYADGAEVATATAGTGSSSGGFQPGGQGGQGGEQGDFQPGEGQGDWQPGEGEEPPTPPEGFDGQGGQGGQQPTDGQGNWQPGDRPDFPDRQQSGWQRTAAGWVYLQADGTKATQWLQEGSTWYYLGSDGVMATGWLKVDGQWFLFDSVNGDMKTGWQQDGNTWYYLGNSGAMKTGWQEWGGAWYYLGWDGAMLVNTTTPDGYLVDQDGRWVR